MCKCAACYQRHTPSAHLRICTYLSVLSHFCRIADKSLIAACRAFQAFWACEPSCDPFSSLSPSSSSCGFGQTA